MVSAFHSDRAYQSLFGLFTCFSVVIVASPGCTAPAGWPQWGGPTRDFMVKVGGLADSWPKDGPEQLWKRTLGDGYSTIVVDGGRLYTMYRTDEDEFTVALDAKTGETIWEHKNPSPFTPLMAQFGPGPHSTPLVVANRLFTIGTNAVMHAFDKKTGRVLWKHDLAAEYDAPVPGRGYACSPIAYSNTIIVPLDRKRSDNGDGSNAEGQDQGEVAEAGVSQSLVAFDQRSGEVVWKSQDYPISYASPILIDFDSEVQLVFLMENEIIGVKPGNGELLWHRALTPQGANIATPLWIGDGLIFCSSAYDSGSRVIKLTKKDGKTVPEELWYSRKMRIHHGNSIRIGDYIYGSSGDSGPAFFVCMNIKTGKRVWIERGFAKSTCVYAGGKFIILDEDGELTLATATPQGLTVHSKFKVATEDYAWAAPTLVGTTLYVRDRHHIMALDLG